MFRSYKHPGLEEPQRLDCLDVADAEAVAHLRIDGAAVVPQHERMRREALDAHRPLTVPSDDDIEAVEIGPATLDAAVEVLPQIAGVVGLDVPRRTVRIRVCDDVLRSRQALGRDRDQRQGGGAQQLQNALSPVSSRPSESWWMVSVPS
jgi:hypothetical protein